MRIAAILNNSKLAASAVIVYYISADPLRNSFSLLLIELLTV
jgi:hypothetical protein